MEIHDMVDTMDWPFFAECAREEEFGLSPYSSDEEESGSEAEPSE